MHYSHIGLQLRLMDRVYNWIDACYVTCLIHPNPAQDSHVFLTQQDSTITNTLKSLDRQTKFSSFTPDQAINAFCADFCLHFRTVQWCTILFVQVRVCICTYMLAMSCTRHHRDLAFAFVWIRRTALLLGDPQEITKPFLLAFYRYSSPRTPLVRMLHDNLWLAACFRQRITHRNIQLSLSSAHRQQRTRLGSLPNCSQPHNTTHFSYLLSLFRYFPAGHFRIHTLTHLN